MNNQNKPLSTLSLRSKLVLSYLIVIIGTVLVLSYSVTQAVQSYYENLQRTNLQQQAQYWEQAFTQAYRTNGQVREQIYTLDALIAFGTQNGIECAQATYGPNDCDNPMIRTALNQALQGYTISFAEMQMTTSSGTIQAYYTAFPVEVDGHIIGALFLAEPTISPESEFLKQINNATLLAGLIIAAVALLCSILLVSRFTRPLKRLTIAAERMKQGQYTQRVPLPKTLDELGLLGRTFNEMADTIEADITELRRQDQMRRDLVANIAHDLATPLTAVQGFSEALADNIITDPEQRQETVQRISREIQRMRRLVSDIQQMSSLEAGRIRLDLAPLDMHTLVDETLAVIAPECEQQEIGIYNDISSQIPLVVADSDRITQVLLNLLDNARRHTPLGGKIQIGAILQNNYVYTWVRDTGSGIDPADLPYIFERFYRADRSRTTATGGNGLGLSIVKAIITAHGGNIWAESTPGEGTRIIFTLPMAAQQEKPTAPANHKPSLPEPKAVTSVYSPRLLPPQREQH